RLPPLRASPQIEAWNRLGRGKNADTDDPTAGGRQPCRLAPPVDRLSRILRNGGFRGGLCDHLAAPLRSGRVRTEGISCVIRWWGGRAGALSLSPHLLVGRQQLLSAGP